MRAKSQEENILGHFLRTPDLLNSVDLGTDFFKSKRQRIVMDELRKGHTDSMIIAEALSKAGVDDPHVYLEDIWTDPLHLGKGGLQVTVDHVKVTRIREQILRLINDGSGRGHYEHDKIRELYDEEQALCDRMEAEQIECAPISKHVDPFIEHVKKRRAGEFWGHKIKSFPRLTHALMGVREIIVLAAKPKIGKTTFALQIESDIADLGVGVIHYDFENGLYNIMARECCRRFDVDYRTELLNDEWTGLDSLTKKIQEIKNFAVVTDRGLTIDKIRAHISDIRKTTKSKDVFIVIDSLQKLPMENLRERRAAIDLWLRAFEELKSDDPDLTILLISELSREGQKPKESGDIEYSAHFLLNFESDQTDDDIRERGDFGGRQLKIEYARDTATGGVIEYKGDFGHWRFTELDADR